MRVAGLLSMREGIAVYDLRAIRALLSDTESQQHSSTWLSEAKVRRQSIAIDEAFEPALPDGSPSGNRNSAFRSTRQRALWYLEGKSPILREDDGAGDTFGDCASRTRAKRQSIYISLAALRPT